MHRSVRLAIVCEDRRRPEYRAAERRSTTFSLAGFDDGSGDTQGTRASLVAPDGQADFDGCVVHGPLEPNRELLLALAAKDKHVLIEPRDADLGALEELAAKFQQRGLLFSVFRPRRYTPYARALRAELQTRHLGTPGLIRIHRWESTPGAKDLHGAMWRMLESEIDLACWLLGDYPEHIYGQASVHDAPDHCQAHLSFADAVGLVDCAHIAGDAYYAASIVGSTGAAYADDHHNTNLLFKTQTIGKRVIGESQWLRFQLDEFAENIARQHEDRSVIEWALAVRAAQAVVQSAATGRVAARRGSAYELV